MHFAAVLFSFVFVAIAAPLPPINDPTSLEAADTILDTVTKATPDASKTTLPRDGIIDLGTVQGIPVVGTAVGIIMDTTADAEQAIPVDGHVVTTGSDTITGAAQGVTSSVSGLVLRDAPADISVADDILHFVPVGGSVDASAVKDTTTGAVSGVVSTASSVLLRDLPLDSTSVDGDAQLMDIVKTVGATGVLSAPAVVSIDIDAVKNTGTNAVSGVATTASSVLSRSAIDGAVDVEEVEPIGPISRDVPAASLDALKIDLIDVESVKVSQLFPRDSEVEDEFC